MTTGNWHDGVIWDAETNAGIPMPKHGIPMVGGVYCGQMYVTRCDSPSMAEIEGPQTHVNVIWEDGTHTVETIEDMRKRDPDGWKPKAWPNQVPLSVSLMHKDGAVYRLAWHRLPDGSERLILRAISVGESAERTRAWRRKSIREALRHEYEKMCKEDEETTP